jgi:hypothetical protein
MTLSANKLTTLRIRRALSAALVAFATVASLNIAPSYAASPDRAQAKTVCRWYVVKRGDSLGELAIRFRTDVLTLRRVNGLKTTRIYIGQKLCIPTVVPSPSPGPGPGPVTGPFFAEFWNNTDQSGSPVIVRNDPAINFAWGYGSPDPARVFADNFSARWTRSVGFDGGIYRFAITSDDGYRLYVDGNLVLDRYSFVGQESRSVDVPIAPGSRVVRLDYVERSGIATIKLGLTKISGIITPGGSGPWRAEYFNNTLLSGSPVALAFYNDLNFNWGTGSPSPVIPRDYFSARFTQSRNFDAGNYRFVAQVDDGIRVYVDDRLVIDEWREQSYRTFFGDIPLTAGVHNIRVEYLEVTNAAALRLYVEPR